MTTRRPTLGAVGLFLALFGGPLGCGSDDLVCGPGQQICGDICVDTAADARNCGGCGAVCATGEVCASGSCALSCPPGQQVCGTGCFTLDSAAAHCGACGNECDPGELCSGGQCQVQCPDGQQICSGGCYDRMTAREHCGGCGNACASGEVCSGGACAPSCGLGLTECSGSCRDLQTDRAHCGACGTTCASGQICASGSCVTSCGTGLTDCGGRCTDTATDRSNCGGCGTACGAAQQCEGGSCNLVCSPGLTPCGIDGCRDVQNDAAHCGSCNTVCDTGEICREGTCEPACGGFAPDLCNGVCTSLQQDAANCGACGTVCPMGNPVCSSGVCSDVCETGLTSCNMRCVNTSIDPANCGFCGITCSGAANALPVCANGGCASVCRTGYSDCDGDLSLPMTNGCEVDLRTDAANCGGCGVACAVPPNAVAACTTGACGLGPCNAGFADCDMNPTNGCEVFLNSNNNNCGTCGTVCPSGEACLSGTCQPFVPTGDSCFDPLPLQPGFQSLAWTSALPRNYLTVSPSCASGFTLDGPDIVLSYTPSISGNVEIAFNKPTSTRWASVVSDAACGTITPQLACISDFTNPSMSGVFPAVAGTTYYVYVADTTSGALPLSNPLEVVISDCNTPTTVISTTPANTSTVSSLSTQLVLNFSRAVSPSAGTIVLTGSAGTMQSLPVSGASVVLSNLNRTLTITPTAPFLPGELVTVTWTGITDTLCTSPVPVVPWSFRVPVPPCTPGMGGLVGTMITPRPTGITSLTEFFVETDNSPTGNVYVGGTTVLHRVPKALGGAVENVHTTAPLTTAQLGYAMLLDGPNIYTVELALSRTDGLLWRISTNNGATWSVTDMATFTPVPGDEFVAGTPYGGRIHLITREFTSGIDTEIWSVDPTAATLPTAARLDRSFGANAWSYCRGLALDDTYYYTQCRDAANTSQYGLLRIHRTTGAITEITRAIPANTLPASIKARDTNNNGVADFLYVQTNRREVYYVCNPAAQPYVDLLTTFGTLGTANYGMGLDTVNNRLWLINDSNRDLIEIQ